MRCLAIIVATLLLVGIAAGSVVGYRQGYDDGYAAAVSDASKLDASNQDTMRMVGVCKWAHLVAGCGLSLGETMKDGPERIGRYELEHAHGR